jgi:hypothetical protein
VGALLFHRLPSAFSRVLKHAVGLAIAAADLAGVHITFGQEDTRVDSRAGLIDIHGGHQAVGIITLAAGCGPLPDFRRKEGTKG